jgi:hypothetical protein
MIGVLSLNGFSGALDQMVYLHPILKFALKKMCCGFSIILFS